MKKVFLALLAVFPLLLSCESLQGERTCTITAPDGTVYRLNPGVACETPSESTTGFVFETSGKKLEDRYLLRLFLNGDVDSQTVSVQTMSLGMPYSSHSNDYSSQFSGKIGLVDVSPTKVVFRLKNVRYTLSRGEYVLNGDLEASR